MDDTDLTSHLKPGLFENGTAGARSHASNSQEFLDTDQTCKLLGVHRNTLYRLIQNDDIPALRLARGGRWRFRRQDLLDWLEARRAGSAR